MTKKEKTVLRGFYEREMEIYMSYVLKHEHCPGDVLERACLAQEIYKALVSEGD